MDDDGRVVDNVKKKRETFLYILQALSSSFRLLTIFNGVSILLGMGRVDIIIIIIYRASTIVECVLASLERSGKQNKEKVPKLKKGHQKGPTFSVIIMS